MLDGSEAQSLQYDSPQLSFEQWLSSQSSQTQDSQPEHLLEQLQQTPFLQLLLTTFASR